MPAWFIYGLFPCYLGFAVGLLIYGLVASLKRVPYDVVSEAEQVALQAWRDTERKARVQDESV